MTSINPLLKRFISAYISLCSTHGESIHTTPMLPSFDASFINSVSNESHYYISNVIKTKVEISTPDFDRLVFLVHRRYHGMSNDGENDLMKLRTLFSIFLVLEFLLLGALFNPALADSTPEAKTQKLTPQNCQAPVMILNMMQRGRYVVLDDQSTWEISLKSLSKAMLWMVGDKVRPCDNHLINEASQDALEAHKIR